MTNSVVSFCSMPLFREPIASLIRDAWKLKSALYSKVSKSDIQQLLVAVKKQEREVSNSMDDSSPKILAVSSNHLFWPPTHRCICVTLLRQARDAVATFHCF
ncbi:hypothetical protein BT96DRAFT_946514 [Gymnopus androsaceus JB14]|uniref:Uncharacterized protein n=1 Tax=Gymnopus androsaceus JB14 TaxID=1447944 RepID=A0A6A4GWY2_9AGAR|nr:hypothetical protein BT96DRAFT_946514 [Gymnopus androsaceus JB14]